MQKKSAPPTIDSSELEQATPLFSQLMAKTSGASKAKSMDGLLIGCLSGYNQAGLPLVSVPGIIDPPTVAHSVCSLQRDDVGRQCALMWIDGQQSQPVIIGLLQQPVITLESDDNLSVEEQADTIDIHANKTLRFHCGKASIHLHADGRIDLRGSTVVSHSTGLNRIRGASVKLN